MAILCCEKRDVCDNDQIASNSCKVGIVSHVLSLLGSHFFAVAKG